MSDDLNQLSREFSKAKERVVREELRRQRVDSVSQMPRAVLESQLNMAIDVIEQLQAEVDRQRAISKKLLLLSQPSMEELNGILNGLG